MSFTIIWSTEGNYQSMGNLHKICILNYEKETVKYEEKNGKKKRKT